MHLPQRLSRLWTYWTGDPRRVRYVHWCGLCAAGLVASLLVAAYLEEIAPGMFFGSRHPGWGPAILLSRYLSGPSYAFRQHCYRMAVLGSIWEVIILYSIVQWVLISIVGTILLRRIPRLQIVWLIVGTAVILAVFGFCLSDAPRSGSHTLEWLIELQRDLHQREGS